MDKPRRKNIRLRDFDYSSPGAYFITICTYQKERLLGEIRGGEMAASSIGKIVQDAWVEIPEHFANVDLDEFIVMPNHIHGVIWIFDRVGAQFIAPRMSQTCAYDATDRRPGNRGFPGQGAMNRAPTLGAIIRIFKAKSSFSIRKAGYSWFAWQRNYYERIIRNEDELNRIRRYILDNPENWAMDLENQNK